MIIKGLFALFLLLMLAAVPILAQHIHISNDVQAKKIQISNAKMKAVFDYNHQANISFLAVNGQEVINGPEGIFSAIKTATASYSTLALSKSPSIKIVGYTVTVSGIIYGDKHSSIEEKWVLTIDSTDIKLGIERKLSKAIEAETLSSPAIHFSSIHTWEGAFQDYGGLAWFYLFNKKSAVYGTHSRSADFWNNQTNNGLNISINAPAKQIAMQYGRNEKDQLAYGVTVAASEIRPQFDSGTHRRLFLRDTATTVWAPVKMAAAVSKQSITLSYFDFNEKYGRGNLVGINGDQVSAVLNTIARIGVIDKEHFGGNSWHTPYGPICLHEQYIAEMGLAINDPHYLKGYQQCLDFYRDNAIRPDGHVMSRWAYSNEDAMPGQFNHKGFYEAQWGFLLDANPDIVTNVSELYNQTGNKAWVTTQQRSCEKVLDWLLKRDVNNNGLVEMMTDSMQQKKGSDWIDIIWSSYENAFVNAKLYHALTLWAAIEKQLGNAVKEQYYSRFAQKLKTSFNKSTADGGFWDEEKKCYIHWRDKNGSIHGRNMVIPVNFMAIGYGICDDTGRTKIILDTIEEQMQQEQLFFWPLCMSSYAKGEGNDWQFPFPEYENGDIFLSWGALGVKAYAGYKPELALKYVKNVLAQYAKDGLAFQRYGRVKQDGRGDDILSGNSLSVVGLYDAIYGINPLYNRFYLNPHITPELSGTHLLYNYRGQKWTIDLEMNKYTVSNKQFSITDTSDFGIQAGNNEMVYFNGKREQGSLQIKTAGKLAVQIKTWNGNEMRWTQSSGDTANGSILCRVYGLVPNSVYIFSTNKRRQNHVRTNSQGVLMIACKANTGEMTITKISKG